jgi:hypothetical protein
MHDHATFLPATPDVAIAHLRAATAALASAEEARADAVATVREAVMAARVMKISWDTIGNELGVSRQAAAERFGGNIRAQLVTAWHGIEMLLAEVAVARRYPRRPIELLEQLGREGAVPADIVAGALRLYKARSRAVHTANPEVTAADAERLTDVAIPLVGMLWLLQHASEFDDNGGGAHH